MKRMNVNLKDNELMDLYIYEYNCFRITKSMPLTKVQTKIMPDYNLLPKLQPNGKLAKEDRK